MASSTSSLISSSALSVLPFNIPNRTIACSASNDDDFGPFVVGTCREGFDFTLLFEQSILTLIPSAVYFLLSLPRIRYLWFESAKLLPNRARVWKLAIASVFLGLQISLVILWVQNLSHRTLISIATTIVNLLVAIQHFPVTWLENERSIRPASLLSAYLLFSILLDAIQARTLWLQGNSISIAAVFSACIGTKILMLAAETQQKRQYLQTAYKHLPPESLSGIINRSLIWWINSLVKQGFRSFLVLKDLYGLDHELKSVTIFTQARRFWEKRNIPERRYEFLWAMVTALKWPLIWTIPPRLIMIAFTFAQPLLIRAVLKTVQSPETEANKNMGYALILAAALIYTGLGISRLHYYQSTYRFVTMIRGAAISLIHDRALQMQDGTHDESAAITLMSTDVDRIYLCFTQLNELWAGLIEIVIGIVLLGLQLGWVCVVPLVIVFGTSLGTKYVAGQIGSRQKVWLAAVQTRISLTASVLADMRSIKMLGLEKIIMEIIQLKRVQEMKFMRHWLWCNVWQNVLDNIPYALSPSVTLTVYAIQAARSGKDSIDTVQAFTTLSIITLLTDPASRVLGTIPIVASSISCFDRIQNFMISSSREDCRTELEISGSHSTSPPVQSLHSADSVFNSKENQHLSIQLVKVSIRPAASASVVLSNVNLNITTCSLSIFTGAVASGKTLLLRAILGDVSPESGTIGICSRRIAYCSQVPWLVRGSIRDVICGFETQASIDENWYKACLYACALDEDIRMLPSGDQTIIESNNTRLSGGQKQRVCLARALYARPHIVILDDVLSALDRTTQEHVVEHLFGISGLFRKLGSAALLVSHSSEYLRYADKVYELSEGTVQLQQTHRQSLHQENVRLKTSPRTHFSEPENNCNVCITQQEPDISHFVPFQDLVRKTGDFQLYTYYLKSFGWIKGSFFFAFVFLQTFFASFSSIWLKWWSESGGEQIARYGSIYFTITVLDTLLKGAYLWAMFIQITPSVGRWFHNILLKTVMRAHQSFFTFTDSGVTLNRFSQDMTMIEERLSTGMILSVSAFFTCVGSAVLVVLGSKYMAATVPLLALVVYVIQHVYLLTSRQLRLLDLEARSPLYSQFLATLSGLATIRAFGWEDASRLENHRLLDSSQRPHYLLSCIRRWLTLVLDLVVGGEAVLVIGLALGLRTSTSPGLLGVSMNAILSFSTNLTYLIAGWTGLETSIGSIARVRDFEKSVKPEAKPGEDQVVSPYWPENGSIIFENVTASHNPESVGIKGLSLNIRPGQRIGICGRTGSGKSSFAGTILRLLEIDSGTIKIDGIDLATISRDTIRERLVVIPQDPLIIFGTLRFNVDPSGQKSDSDIFRALERVGLTDMLTERDGLDTNVLPSSLSRGQQQLLGLSRALLKPGKIVILDEATSNVDSKTDKVMQKVVREEFVGRTVLTIAHRLNTILDSDVIVVMNGGCVAEFGRPQDLLEASGAFSELAGKNGDHTSTITIQQE